MSVGLPVVCSNARSLPEVVGNGGVLVDARDDDALANAVRQAYTDEALRRDLVTRGYANAERFTWSSAARKHIAACEEAVTRRRSTAQRLVDAA
jgi:glycosyltransferase involved in cell wall biosynthesis